MFNIEKEVDNLVAKLTKVIGDYAEYVTSDDNFNWDLDSGPLFFSIHQALWSVRVLAFMDDMENGMTTKTIEEILTDDNKKALSLLKDFAKRLKEQKKEKNL